MLPLRKFVLFLTMVAIGGSVHHAIGQSDEKSAAETTVRTYEQACEHFDFEKANSMLAPGARWIEDSYPVPAEFTGKGRWEDYKAAKLRIEYQLRDFDTHIRGDVAWITLSLDGTFTADNKIALALNDNLREWRGTFVETYVLVKNGNEWKIALGHTSLLPKPKE